MQEQFGQYSLIRALAKKNLHWTYLASPLNEPERQVVLTVFASSLPSLSHEQKNLLQKAQRLKKLQYAHLVPIVDLGVEQGQPYVVQEYPVSDSLRQRLDYLAPQRLSLQEALTIIFQVGQALCYVHQHEIVHGNIKPETIFFDSNGEVLLSDFDFVSFFDMTQLSQKADLQTISYQAPEQFAGSITEKSDQYALACLAYELITGRLPFSSQSFLSLVPFISAHGASGKAIERKEKSTTDLAMLIQTGNLCENSQCPDYGQLGKGNIRKYGKTSKGEQRWQCKTCQATWGFSPMWAKDHPELLIPPSDLVPNLPEAVEEPVLKAMAKDPSQRYADVSLFLRTLQSALPLPPSMLSYPLIALSSNTPATAEPIGNIESEVPLSTLPPEHLAQMHNEHNDSKTLVTLARDTYLGAFRPARLSQPGHGKPVTPTLWLAFALSSIILLVGTVILYALMPSRSPGSMRPVKSTPQIQLSAQAGTAPARQPTIRVTTIPTAQSLSLTSTSTLEPPVSYEAEATDNTLGGSAKVESCSHCSGGKRVGYLGQGGSLQFNNIWKKQAGNYTVMLYYTAGDAVSRNLSMIVNSMNDTLQVIDTPSTGSWGTPQAVSITVSLMAGNNTIKFYNPSANASDVDRIVV